MIDDIIAAAPVADCATLPSPAGRVVSEVWRSNVFARGQRELPEEVPIAFTYDGTAHAVMMATPSDLEDFAVGFSLTAATVETLDQIESIKVISAGEGIELRMRIKAAAAEAFHRRRRRLVGPTGCGLCGLESIEDALSPVRPVRSTGTVSASSIRNVLDRLSDEQSLNQRTHAVHAAGFAGPDGGLLVREDVGRHNALDKLVGAMVRSGHDAETGFVVLSSRVSIDMVQKAATLGVPVIVAISAPTAVAVRACAEAGITLIGVARHDGFEVFTHTYRVTA